MGKTLFTTFLSCVFYIVWQLRNDSLFRGGKELWKAVNFFEVQVDEFAMEHNNGAAEVQHWIPLDEGWIKVNVVASHTKNEVTALAFVVRDHKGKLLLLSTTSILCRTPFLAEARALEWACSYAEVCSWQKVIWVSDAKHVLQEVTNVQERAGVDNYP